MSFFRRGLTLARHDHEILLVFAATMIINGAGVTTWLFPKQLVNAGLPNDPVLWYTALGMLSSAIGFVALHIVEARIDGVDAARGIYALACFISLAGDCLEGMLAAGGVGDHPQGGCASSSAGEARLCRRDRQVVTGTPHPPVPSPSTPRSSRRSRHR